MIPVMICRDRIIPSMNPIFHMSEMDLGVGRSIREDVSIFISGWVFISCFFIRMMSLGFGVVCARGILLQSW